MKHLGDITKIDGHNIPLVDIVTGGSPCQDLSVAGKRAGLDGERSGLFMEQIRIIKEMRDESTKRLRSRGSAFDIRCVQPRYMVWENVCGAFSSNKGEDFRCVLEETAKIADENAVIPRIEGGVRWSTSGCILADGWSIAWRVHDAQFWGVPQRRKRISLVADFAGQSAPEILFERKGLQGDFEQSQQKRKSTSRNIGTGIKATGANIYSRKLTGDVVATLTCNCNATSTQPIVVVFDETSESLSFQERAGKEGGGKGILIQKNRTGALSTLNNQYVLTKSAIGADLYNQTLTGNKTKTLNAVGSDADHVPCVIGVDFYNMCETGNIGRCLATSSGGLNEHIPCVTYKKTSHAKFKGDGQGWQETEINDTLNVFDNGESRTPTLIVGKAIESHAQDSRYNIGDINQPLTANMVNDPANGGLALTSKVYDARENGNGETCCTITGNHESFISDYTAIALEYTSNINTIVRRLTPLECERLQGYPDGWTDIGDWTDSKGRLHKGESDSPRYKALGNSIALPFWEWMANRMVNVLKKDGVENPTMASLFDGIGGFPLVYSRCGCKPVWASEIEEFPIAVTKIRFPDNEVTNDR